MNIFRGKKEEILNFIVSFVSISSFNCFDFKKVDFSDLDTNMTLQSKYHMNSTTKFSDFLTERTTGNGKENYNRFGTYSNFMSYSNGSPKILFVIYDEMNFPREVIEFKGTSGLFAWFSANNLVTSSVWDQSKLASAVQFRHDHQGFEITTKSDLPCEEEGYLKLTCDLETTCDQFKWWINEASLENNFCGIVYSNSKDPVNFSNGLWASRVEIYSSDGWDVVFFVNAFSGVNPADYLETGNEINPKGGTVLSDQVFRDSGIESKLENAKTIKFLVYNFEKSAIVSEIDFYGGQTLLNWFSWSNYNYSSLWILEAPTTVWGSHFRIRGDYGRVFLINKSYNGCPNDFGWLVVAVDGVCYYEHWWNKDSIRSRYANEQEIPLSNQPPYILYATTADDSNCEDLSDGGRIEILTV